MKSLKLWYTVFGFEISWKFGYHIRNTLNYFLGTFFKDFSVDCHFDFMPHNQRRFACLGQVPNILKPQTPGTRGRGNIQRTRTKTGLSDSQAQAFHLDFQCLDRDCGWDQKAGSWPWFSQSVRQPTSGGWWRQRDPSTADTWGTKSSECTGWPGGCSATNLWILATSSSVCILPSWNLH